MIRHVAPAVNSGAARLASSSAGPRAPFLAISKQDWQRLEIDLHAAGGFLPSTLLYFVPPNYDISGH